MKQNDERRRPERGDLARERPIEAGVELHVSGIVGAVAGGDGQIVSCGALPGQAQAP